MELEKETMNRLITYLKEHGYPDTSFAIEYLINNRRIDLAIIDPETKIPLFLFEVKSKRTDETIEIAKRHLEDYLKTLPDSTIPTFLVFPKDESPFFEVQRISFDFTKKKIVKQTLEENDNTQLNFEMHKQSRISERIEKNHSDRDSAVGWFSKICWILAIVVIIIVALKKFEQIEIDPTDIALIGVFVGLAILPFASKLKFLGMEFERFELKKKKKHK